MSRKDYVSIASQLSFARPCNAGAYDGWLAAVKAVADALQADNPRFDRSRFLTACGVPKG